MGWNTPNFFVYWCLFLLKIMGHSKSPIYSQPQSLLIEIPSLNRNERIAILECGRNTLAHTHQDDV